MRVVSKVKRKRTGTSIRARLRTARPARNRRHDALLQRIEAFNRGRDPVRLGRKFDAMARDAFTFYRGTCHLWYRDWPAGSVLGRAPRGWICGDMHVENFGSYRGENGLVYFDINDFDESTLAPIAFDVVRCATSVLLAARRFHRDPRVGEEMARAFFDGYEGALHKGKPNWLERSTARGPIRQLLRAVRNRSQDELVEAFTRGRHRDHLRVDGDHLLATPTPEAEETMQWLSRHLGKNARRRKFEPLAVVRRAVGTGSLGIPRWVILARVGGGGGRRLFDLKEARPSAAARSLAGRQPVFANDAQRIVGVQGLVQAASPRFTEGIAVGSRSFVFRELQPYEDKLSLSSVIRLGTLARLVGTLGKIVAWGHLRASGHLGAASADELMDWSKGNWRRPAFAYAKRYKTKVERDWKIFAAARKKGWGKPKRSHS